MAALGEMSAGMAHEVNNPLAIIVGKITSLKKKLIRNDLNLDEFQTDLRKIEEASHRIAKIVSGLQSFSRLSDRDDFKLVEVENIFTDLSTLCSERFKYHDIDLQFNYEKANGLCFNGRQAQIEQVLLNLLNNSFDAIQSSPNRWIHITARLENHRILIMVTDSGKGISNDILQKMMQPFFTTKEVGKGTGLGLSISKGINFNSIIFPYNGQIK